MDALIEKVLVPIDFSPASERAAQYGASLARRLSASLHLVHVLEPAAMVKGPFEFYEPPSREFLDQLYWNTRSRLVALGSTLEGGFLRVSSEVRHGTPAESICAATIDYGADLVVMSTHGRSGLSHLLMGSVAEQVIRTSRCPVLVLRDCGQVHVHRPAVAEVAELEPVGQPA
jgi:nucleotide-binding universal stress UspA family protein